MQTMNVNNAGKHPVKLTEELLVGDKLVCSFNYTREIVRVISETAKTITFEVLEDYDNKIYVKRLNKGAKQPVKA